MSFYRQMHVFRTVMTSSSLAEAADRLFLTQPAVTKQIKSLEVHLDVQLFSRDGHRLQPNDLAQTLYDSSGEAIAAMQTLERNALNLRDRNKDPVRIVAMPMIARLWLPQRIGAVFEQAPGSEFTIRVARSERIREMLETGQADIGIGMLNRWSADFRTKPIIRSNAVVILPRNHPLAASSSLAPADLVEQDFFLLGAGSAIRQEILSAFSVSGMRPRIKAEIELEETTVTLVEAGLGVSVIDSYSAEHRQKSGSQIAIVPFEPRIVTHIGVMLSRQTRASVVGSRIFGLLSEA